MPERYWVPTSLPWEHRRDKGPLGRIPPSPKEQVGLVLTGAIARRDPRVPFAEDVAGDRRRGGCARPRPPLDAVREDDEPAAPVGRHLDEVARSAEHPASADRRAVRLGTRGDGPEPWAMCRSTSFDP